MEAAVGLELATWCGVGLGCVGGVREGGGSVVVIGVLNKKKRVCVDSFFCPGGGGYLHPYLQNKQLQADIHIDACVRTRSVAVSAMCTCSSEMPNARAATWITCERWCGGCGLIVVGRYGAAPEIDFLRPSVVWWCVSFLFLKFYLGVQPLPHLGAPVGDQHGPVLVHVHERAALLCFVLGGWDGTGWVRIRGKEGCLGSSFCVPHACG